MANFRVDTSELRALSADLTRAHRAIGPNAMKVVERGALNIKRQLQTEARASKHFKGFASGINYDMSVSGGEIKAEIGPVKGHPGSLANIAYFGTSRGGGTVPAPDGALHAEVGNVERYLGELLERFLI